MSRRTGGLAALEIDPMHGEATKFMAMVLVSRDDAPSPAQARPSADTTMDAIDHFFPEWSERRRWMSLALQQARDRWADSTIKLGDTLLSVEWNVPLGGDQQSTYALIPIDRAAPR